MNICDLGYAVAQSTFGGCCELCQCQVELPVRNFVKRGV